MNQFAKLKNLLWVVFISLTLFGFTSCKERRDPIPPLCDPKDTNQTQCDGFRGLDK